MARSDIDGGKEGSVCLKILNIVFLEGKKNLTDGRFFLDAPMF